ncbi:uncharacterized protein [Ptychodera flava]|uniref:uncharacterized protein n=1 Tax=Ptychodera flava TaxID=63121 RepID=UPI00396A29DE
MRLQVLALLCTAALTFAVDEDRSKPGSCPAVEADTVGICVDVCTGDVTCPGTKKCCPNGCGHTCQEPPRVKPGQCPIPNGDLGTCAQSCVSDSDCYGNKKCCHNGCGTECMELPLEDAQGACRFARMMVETAIASMGPRGGSSVLYVPQCDDIGNFQKVQCDDRAGLCWCANRIGTRLPNTLVQNYTKCDQIELADSCESVDVEQCRTSLADKCKFGFQAGADGCPICACYKPCDGFTCPAGTVCKPMHVLCSEQDCPGIPQCVPELDNSMCEKDVEPVTCPIDPCASAACPAHPTATCKIDYCGHCKAVFYDTMQNKVDCNEQGKFECPRQDSDIVTTCVNTCGNGCPTGKMCCSVGCRRECLTPVPIALTSCQQAQRASKNIWASPLTAAQLERYTPRCTTDGRYEEIQCAEHIGICWCVDQNTGQKIEGTQVRGNPDCGGEGTEEAVTVCEEGEHMQRCAQNLCYQAVCLAHPAAVCRVNPCGECTVHFYDHLNNIIDCNDGLQTCQKRRQTALNSNNRGVLSPDLLKNITHHLPAIVQSVVNQLGGVCGIPSSMSAGNIPGFDKLEGLPDVNDIFQVLFGQGDAELPSLDDLTDAIESMGGDLAEATGFTIEDLFDHFSTFRDFFRDLFIGGDDDDSRRKRRDESGLGSAAVVAPLFGPYIAQCADDGAFEWKQCHGNTGVCWCVNSDGKAFPGSVTAKPASKTLRCNQNGQVEGTGEGQQFTCPNNNELKLCLDVACSRDYCPSNPDAFCVIDPCNNCEETWKTCEDLGSTVNCSEVTPGHMCPDDKPAQICPEDLCAKAVCRWNHCATCRMDVCGGCQAKFYDENKQEVNCEKPVSKCLLANQCKTGRIGEYRPQCDSDGKFKSTQCHPSTGYCWCVNQAGVEIPDTKQRGQSNCGQCFVT